MFLRESLVGYSGNVIMFRKYERRSWKTVQLTLISNLERTKGVEMREVVIVLGMLLTLIFSRLFVRSYFLSLASPNRAELLNKHDLGT